MHKMLPFKSTYTLNPEDPTQLMDINGFRLVLKGDRKLHSLPTARIRGLGE